MTSFRFDPIGHPVADGFLSRAASHLATLTPEQQAHWFSDWIPAMRRAPLKPGMTVIDLGLVIMILEGWQREVVGEVAA